MLRQEFVANLWPKLTREPAAAVVAAATTTISLSASAEPEQSSGGDSADSSLALFTSSSSKNLLRARPKMQRSLEATSATLRGPQPGGSTSKRRAAAAAARLHARERPSEFFDPATNRPRAWTHTARNAHYHLIAEDEDWLVPRLSATAGAPFEHAGAGAAAWKYIKTPTTAASAAAVEAATSQRLARSASAASSASRGNSVPVVFFSNARVGRREWIRQGKRGNAGGDDGMYCSICNLPASAGRDSYLHSQSKDHRLLDQLFESGLVEFDRSWVAHRLLDEVAGRFPRLCAVSRDDLRDEAFFPLPQLRTRRDPAARASGGLARLLRKCQRIVAEEERLRRLELLFMLQFLLEPDTGAIDPVNARAAADKGTFFGIFRCAHMALHAVLPAALLRLTPATTIESFSHLEDFSASAYNMETFYDMASLHLLSSPLLGGLVKEKHTTLNTKSNFVRALLAQLKQPLMGVDQQNVCFSDLANISVDSGDAGDNTESAGSPCWQKQHAVILEKARLFDEVVGAKAGHHQQRDSSESWLDEYLHAIELDQIEFEQQQQEEQQEPPRSRPRVSSAALFVLMNLTAKAIVTDLLHCRVSEYVVRAEPAWLDRSIGSMEQLIVRLPARAEGPDVRVQLSLRPELWSAPWKWDQC